MDLDSADTVALTLERTDSILDDAAILASSPLSAADARLVLQIRAGCARIALRVGRRLQVSVGDRAQLLAWELQLNQLYRQRPVACGVDAETPP